MDLTDHTYQHRLRGQLIREGWRTPMWRRWPASWRLAGKVWSSAAVEVQYSSFRSSARAPTAGGRTDKQHLTPRPCAHVFVSIPPRDRWTGATRPLGSSRQFADAEHEATKLNQNAAGSPAHHPAPHVSRQMSSKSTLRVALDVATRDLVNHIPPTLGRVQPIRPPLVSFAVCSVHANPLAVICFQNPEQ